MTAEEASDAVCEYLCELLRYHSTIMSASAAGWSCCECACFDARALSECWVAGGETAGCAAAVPADACPLGTAASASAGKCRGSMGVCCTDTSGGDEGAATAAAVEAVGADRCSGTARRAEPGACSIAMALRPRLDGGDANDGGGMRMEADSALDGPPAAVAPSVAGNGEPLSAAILAVRPTA